MMLHVDSRSRFTLLTLPSLLAPAARPGLSTARHCVEWIAPAFCRTRVEHPLDLGTRQGRTGSRSTGPDFDFSLPHPSTLISTCQLLIFTKSHVRILKMFPPPDCISVSQQWSVYWTGCLVPPPPHSFARLCHTGDSHCHVVSHIFLTFCKPVQRGKRRRIL